MDAIIKCIKRADVAKDERDRVLQLILSQERVISLLYEKTFPSKSALSAYGRPVLANSDMTGEDVLNLVLVNGDTTREDVLANRDTTGEDVLVNGDTTGEDVLVNGDSTGEDVLNLPDIEMPIDSQARPSFLVEEGNLQTCDRDSAKSLPDWLYSMDVLNDPAWDQLDAPKT
ncbi:hypothetical protein T484DRAFT_1813079 [Baffinella frigidus]|nr:hypothetical protein T484DRAFT_1813079 [Cryptophyta sp. CCMP2293]